MKELLQNCEFGVVALQLCTVALALTGTILLIRRWVRDHSDGVIAELEATRKANAAVSKLADFVLLAAVTAAENNNAPGTGELKRAQVISQLYRLLPDSLREKADPHYVGLLVDQAVAAAKEVWLNQPGMLTTGWPDNA